MLTYGQAKKILARYSGIAGTCTDSDKLDIFCKKVFQSVLWAGTYGSIRKFCFSACKGCITVPYELETPIKIKVENHIGVVFNKWYEFYNVHELEGCEPVGSNLYEESNSFCTVYDLPNKFCRVGVLGTATESTDAHIIVSGRDPSGREIYTTHAGEKIAGEYLKIEKGKVHHTQVVFGEITGISKTVTNGYVQLLWTRPELSLRGFLADYAPSEEVPEYRRFKLTSPCGPSVKVSILGRIRLKEKYADNERIPFDNILALELAGQSANASYNNDVQLAEAQDTRMVKSVTRESVYKTSQTGSALDVYVPTSGGAVKNIV